MAYKRKVPFTMAVVIAAFFCFSWINPLSIQPQSTISFEDQVRYQTLIEDLRWSYTSWPEENTKAKPSSRGFSVAV